ncbi:MAG TPA: hypothetical protein VF992_08640 [Thermoplasmata archaeon]
MRKEHAGLILIAVSSYALIALIWLMRLRVIDYSPYDFLFGIMVGFLIVVIASVFIVGLAIVIGEATARPHQPWL